MQILYAYFKHSDNVSINKFEKELFFSIEKTHELYHYLLSLICEIVNYAEKRIFLAQNKKMPTEAELNPNKKLVDNQITPLIQDNAQLTRFLGVKNMNWSDYPDLIRNIFKDMEESEVYKKYMSSRESKFEEDKKFIIALLNNIIQYNDQLYASLEEKSIYWNDEGEFVIKQVINTLRRFKLSKGENNQLLPLFRNEDDIEYTKALFRKTILNQKELNGLIEKFSKNWNLDRIAFMDNLLIQMAICEAKEFSSIPIKVTIDEYIELSKYYSTEKSNVFINGILDKVFAYLKEKGEIQKTGRGLID